MSKQIAKYMLIGLLGSYAFALAVYAMHFPDRLSHSKNSSGEFAAMTLEVPVLAFEVLFGATDNADVNAIEVANKDLVSDELGQYRFTSEKGALSCIATLSEKANFFSEDCATAGGNLPSAGPTIHRIQVYFWTSAQLCLLQKSQLFSGFRSLRCYYVVN